MAEYDNFIEKNKLAIMQELRGGIGTLQSLISEKLPEVLQENEEPIPPQVTETYMDMSLSIGYIVGLFNELQTLEFGIEESQPQNPIGFGALLNNKEN